MHESVLALSDLYRNNESLRPVSTRPVDKIVIFSIDLKVRFFRTWLSCACFALIPAPCSWLYGRNIGYHWYLIVLFSSLKTDVICNFRFPHFLEECFSKDLFSKNTVKDVAFHNVPICLTSLPDDVWPWLRRCLICFDFVVQDGRICDRYHMMADRIPTSHGVHLIGRLLAVFSLQHQTIHFLHVKEKTGQFVIVKRLGRFFLTILKLAKQDIVGLDWKIAF